MYGDVPLAAAQLTPPPAQPIWNLSPESVGAGEGVGTPISTAAEPPMLNLPDQTISSPSRRDPSTLSFGGGGGSEGGTSAEARKAAASLLAQHAVNVPAADIPRINPKRIGELEKAGEEEEAAQKELGRAQANEARATATGETLRADALRKSAADIAQKSQARDAYLQGLQDKYDAFSEHVSNLKEDPLHWAHSQTTAQKLGYVLAGALGGFLEGFRGTPNRTMEQIRSLQDKDIAAQRAEIEQKKGRLADMKGGLAEAYRRTGNLEQAEALVRATSFEQLDAEQKAYAATSHSATVEAQSRLQSAEFQKAKVEELAKYYAYQPAHTAAAGGVTPKMLEEARAYYKEAAASGKNVSFDDALLEVVSEHAGHGAFGSATFGKTEKPGGAAGAEKSAEKVRAYDNAIDKLERIRAMVKEGGSFSRSRTAEGETLTAALINELARAETGGTRAPSEPEQELIKKQLPHDPNAFQWTDADLTRIETTLANARTAREREAEAAGLGRRRASPKVGFEEGVQ
jgi:hypothetical protein